MLAFSEHHFEGLIKHLKFIPKVGNVLYGYLKEFLLAEKNKLHRRPDQANYVQVNFFF